MKLEHLLTESENSDDNQGLIERIKKGNLTKEDIEYVKDELGLTYESKKFVLSKFDGMEELIKKYGTKKAISLFELLDEVSESYYLHSFNDEVSADDVHSNLLRQTDDLLIKFFKKNVKSKKIKLSKDDIEKYELDDEDNTKGMIQYFLENPDVLDIGSQIHSAIEIASIAPIEKKIFKRLKDAIIDIEDDGRHNIEISIDYDNKEITMDSKFTVYVSEKSVAEMVKKELTTDDIEPLIDADDQIEFDEFDMNLFNDELEEFLK